MQYEITRNEEKNKKIKQRPGGRGIGFEDIVYVIANQGDFKIIENKRSKYLSQLVIIVSVNGYPYEVPCRRDGNVLYLITAFPSRRYKQL